MQKKKTAAKRHAAPTGVQGEQDNDTISRLEIVGSTLPQRRSQYTDWDSVIEFANANAGQWIKVKKYASRSTASSVRRYVKERYNGVEASCREAVLYIRVV